MATHKLVLGSIASLVAAGAIIAAVPVSAQDSTGPDSAAEAYSAARADYNAKLEAFNENQQSYERQRAQYNAELTAYQNELNKPAPVVVARDPPPDVVVVDPAPVVVVDPDRAVVVDDPALDPFVDRLAIVNIPPRLVRVENVVDANDRLFNAPVLDAAGLSVGHFRRVETQRDGDVVAVITLNNSRRTISMLTEHVRLDPATGLIIADLTAREIDTIPSGFPYS